MPPEEKVAGADVPACLCCRLCRGGRAGPGNPRRERGSAQGADDAGDCLPERWRGVASARRGRARLGYPEGGPPRATRGSGGRTRRLGGRGALTLRGCWPPREARPRRRGGRGRRRPARSTPVSAFYRRSSLALVGSLRLGSSPARRLRHSRQLTDEGGEGPGGGGSATRHSAAEG